MVRDAIAYADRSQTPLRVLSLDFTEAFDRISHRYLFKLLAGYGFSTKFIDLIKNMYDQAYSSIHIDGHTTAPFPIQCGVRHGCPLSMLLFALSLNPLLWLLDQTLTGIRIGRATRTAVVAYADDMTLFMTDPRDIPILADTLRRYEEATGARLNIQKSKAMAAGSWDTTVNMMDIPYYTDMTILGFQFSNAFGQSEKSSWTRVTGKVRAMAKEVYGRNLCLTQRIHYVQTFLLTKIWHIAQIFPVPKEHARQLATAITWFIWKGTIFRVPLSTLQRRKEDGGLELLDIGAKCRALFLTKLRDQGTKEGMLTAAWLQRWGLREPKGNPPHTYRIPRKFQYLLIYALEWAYLEPRKQEETLRTFKRRVYETLKSMATVEIPPRELRVKQIQPGIEWERVWSNLHSIPTSEGTRSAWYMVIHDLIPTNTRLHRIWLVDTEECTLCGKQDTMIHKLTECGVGEEIWEWTHVRLAAIHRTDRRRIPPGWLLGPDFRLWPRQRHLATLWILVNLVFYIVHNRRTMSLEDYIDFLRRS